MDISSLLEVEVKEGKASDLQNNGEIAAYRNIPDFSIRDIASVRFRKLHCTACDTHIGSAPSAAHNMHEHPVLHVLLCTACREFYGDGTFEQGDDATDMFCRWCANGGNLYCCSYCSNTFCYNCIKRNFDAVVRKKIERDEKWKCFVCNPADLYSARAACWALLQHVQTVTRILQTDRKMSAKEIQAKMDLDESQCCPHRNKRKRSETVSDDEEHDETYNFPKKKRRKYSSSKRRRNVVKLEEHDGTSDSASNEVSREVTAIRESEDARYADVRGSRTEARRLRDERAEREDSPEETSVPARQRSRRLRAESASLAKFAITEDDIAATLLECDQTMVEGAESLTFGTVPAGGTFNSEQPRNMGISTVPMVQLMKRPVPPKGPFTRGGKTHRLVRGAGGTPVLVRKIAPAISNVVANVASTVQTLPMVTIPSLNHVQTGNRVSTIQTVSLNNQDANKSSAPAMRAIRPRPLVPKIVVGAAPTVSNSRVTNVPPSVIDLDSDSDEPSVVLVAPSSKALVPTSAASNKNNNNNNERRNSESDDRLSDSSTPTHGPARTDDDLVTIITPTRNTDAQSNNDNTSAKTFGQTIRRPTISVEATLDALKSKIKKVMESKMSPLPEQQLIAARAKTRAVNRTIKRTVAELNAFNEDLVRAYRNYERERTKETTSHTESIVLEPRQKSRLFIPLEMTCTRESEPECDETFTDDENEDENSQNFPPVTEIIPFRRRVNRAVEAKPQTKCKSVQAYDVRTRDYETSVGYALLLKADYDSKRQRDILRPVVVPDENFGKYEDEFINYLQHIEDRGIETEETKEFDDSPPTVSINELVEADISAIIDDIANNRTKAYEITKEQMMDENVEILEEHVEIVTTKLITSDESNSSPSVDNSEDETNETRTTALPENKDQSSIDKVITDEKTSEEKIVSRDTSSVSNDATEVSNVVDKTTDSSTTTVPATAKNDGRANDEETVLAVRALIEDDSTENASTTDILNSWKPVDSDDECTIID